MSQRMYESVTVKLKCGHTNAFYPRPFDRDVVWCAACCSYQEVVGGGIGENRFAHSLECMGCGYRQANDYIGVIYQWANDHVEATGHDVIVT